MTDSPLPIEPHRTALLVMDYQPGIVAMIEPAEALLERVNRAIELMRESGGEVGYVRVAFEDSELDSFPSTSRMGANLAAGDRDRLAADSPQTQVDERVAPRQGDIVVRKTRVGAFSTTDLEQQLRGLGIDTLVLAGISTSGVVLSTVRDAHDRDYRLYVLSDASADRAPGMHEFLTEKIFPRQADVITVDELERLLVAGGS